MDFKVVYVCPKCYGRFASDELDTMVEVEPGEYEHVCPKDGKPLKWGLEICK